MGHDWDPIELSVHGGLAADRVAYAFLAGYQGALRTLFGHVDGVASLCATESGGARPSQIETRLDRTGQSWELTGEKSWASVAGEASELFVLATTGRTQEGRNRRRVVRIGSSDDGVSLTPWHDPL